MNRMIVLTILAGGALWDYITAVYGTTQMLGVANIAPVAGIIFGTIISAFMFYSYDIHKIRTEGFPILIKPLWAFAALYDLYTSFVGNHDFVVKGTIDGSNVGRIFVLVGLTVFVTSCPIIFSYLWRNPTFLRDF